MNKKLLEDLQSSVQEHDKRRTKGIQRLVNVLELQILLASEEIKKGITDSAIDTIAHIRSVIDELMNITEIDLVDDLMELFDEEFLHVEAQLKKASGVVSFGGTDIDVVERLINVNFSKAQRAVGRYVGDFESLVINNIVANAGIDIKKIAEEYGEKAARQVTTEMDTALATFNRSVSVHKALEVSDSDDPSFAYVGPLDKLTRPFCRAHVGQIKKRSEWSALSNGQYGDVMTSAGGYNCRHQLIWVPNENNT